MKYNDIVRFPTIHYSVDCHWMFLEEQISTFINEYGLQICPDFQRGYVWTEAQQVAYIEFMLKEGESGRDIYLNHPGWMNGFKGEFVLVDGLQRLTAARKFVANELRAFGYLAKEMGRKIPLSYRLRFHVARLKTRAEVLEWYVAFNEGGTPHPKEEIDRVKSLLAAELNKGG